VAVFYTKLHDGLLRHHSLRAPVLAAVEELIAEEGQQRDDTTPCSQLAGLDGSAPTRLMRPSGAQLPAPVYHC